jgi:hypothetical protein
MWNFKRLLWPLVLKFAGSNPAEAVGFFGRKNPQHAFLPRGSKAVCPMSCLTACKITQKWRGSRHFRQNFSPIVPPSPAGFASVASDGGGILWRMLERSKSLVLLQVGGWTCRWQRHSVKPSCWECSTRVEQAEPQITVVVPIEEEEECEILFLASCQGSHLLACREGIQKTNATISSYALQSPYDHLRSKSLKFRSTNICPTTCVYLLMAVIVTLVQG